MNGTGTDTRFGVGLGALKCPNQSSGAPPQIDKGRLDARCSVEALTFAIKITNLSYNHALHLKLLTIVLLALQFRKQHKEGNLTSRTH